MPMATTTTPATASAWAEKHTSGDCTRPGGTHLQRPAAVSRPFGFRPGREQSRSLAEHVASVEEDAADDPTGDPKPGDDGRARPVRAGGRCRNHVEEDRGVKKPVAGVD